MYDDTQGVGEVPSQKTGPDRITRLDFRLQDTMSDATTVASS
jgi:hypothetical protein